jgi:hypothetical protein
MPGRGSLKTSEIQRAPPREGFPHQVFQRADRRRALFFCCHDHNVPRHRARRFVRPVRIGQKHLRRRHFKASQIISSDQCRVMIVDDAATQAINEDTFALLSHWLELR